MTTMPAKPAVALTLWTEDDLARAVTPRVQALLRAARPDVAMVHAGPDRLHDAALKVAADARAVLPTARLWLGVGWLVWVERLARGQATHAQVVAKMLGAARLASDLGAELVAWDAEDECETDAARPLVAAVAAEVIAAVRARFPALVQAHTYSDHPDGKHEYPWRAFCGAGGVDLALPQVYCAPKSGLAPPGALRTRWRSSEASIARATAAGAWRAELPRAPYVQVHGVPAGQTVTACAESPVVACWAAPDRIDAEGERAVRALCALRRHGYTGSGALARFQADAGLHPDGVAGEGQTMPALLALP